MTNNPYYCAYNCRQATKDTLQARQHIDEEVKLFIHKNGLMERIITAIQNNASKGEGQLKFYYDEAFMAERDFKGFRLKHLHECLTGYLRTLSYTVGTIYEKESAIATGMKIFWL